MSLTAALQIFEQRRQPLLDALYTFLRFPTISAQSEHQADLAACAAWIKQQLEQAGLHSEVIPTAKHPVVFADSGPPTDARPHLTLLCYGHYDVQPIGDEKLWKSPAFEPTLREGAIFARGSADDKGQVMTHLAAMQCWHATGQPLPVRIKFLIEGEEEIGSPNLPAFVRQNAERLSCDYVVLSDTGKLATGMPALAHASRGLVYKEVTLQGPARDLHSGQYGGAVANPANVLAGIIAQLKDAQGRVTIPGFYDDVVGLDPASRERLTRHGLTDAALLENTGCAAPDGEAGYTSAERCTARPTLDVNGLCSGYTGEGSATIIPSRAVAKISMRLVGNQNPEAVSKAFDDTVRRLCPPSVTLTIRNFSHCAAYLAPTDSPGMSAAAKALEHAYGQAPALTREGGTLPILPMFKQVLNADSLMLGFAASDCNLHSPNEFFHVTDFVAGTRCILHLIHELADAKH